MRLPQSDGKYLQKTYSQYHFNGETMNIFPLRSEIKQGEPDQDGGIGRWGAHLLPQIHQKYIYMWNSSPRILAECWQKIS